MILNISFLKADGMSVGTRPYGALSSAWADAARVSRQLNERIWIRVNNCAQPTILGSVKA